MAYDPAQHNVDEVLAYVAEHPDERQPILDAETAGQARKTLLEALRPAEKDTVWLSVLWPHDVFDPSLDGVPKLTRAGTAVPASKVDEVLRRARKAGVRIARQES